MYKRLELHNHTNESDAVFTCKELTDFMVADQVDAFALTDHNTISGHCKIKNYLKEHPQPIDFIPGMEYTTYYGLPVKKELWSAWHIHIPSDGRSHRAAVSR